MVKIALQSHLLSEIRSRPQFFIIGCTKNFKLHAVIIEFSANSAFFRHVRHTCQCKSDIDLCQNFHTSWSYPLFKQHPRTIKVSSKEPSISKSVLRKVWNPQWMWQGFKEKQMRNLRRREPDYFMIIHRFFMNQYKV